MTDKIEKESVADKLERGLAKSGKLVAIVAVAAAVVIAVVSIVVVMNAKASSKNIEQIDTITNVYTKDAADLEGDALTERQNKALSDLSALVTKGGIAGVRANMLSADIYYAQKKYNEAKEAWVKAAELNKKAYTASLSYFNAAVCAEELNDTDSAVAYYKAASENKDFVLIDHVLFSLGRVYESKEAYADAKAAYESLKDLHSTSNWAQAANSRLIALKAAGNIQ